MRNSFEMWLGVDALHSSKGMFRLLVAFSAEPDLSLREEELLMLENILDFFLRSELELTKL
jgi:hypothetical protein